MVVLCGFSVGGRAACGCFVPLFVCLDAACGFSVDVRVGAHVSIGERPICRCSCTCSCSCS